jgi:hypothetical protein
VLQTKRMNALDPSVLDLNSLLRNVNSLFLSYSDDSTESASECISIQYSGRARMFQGVARCQVLNSGIAVDTCMSSGRRNCVVRRVVLDVREDAWTHREMRAKAAVRCAISSRDCGPYFFSRIKVESRQ